MRRLIFLVVTTLLVAVSIPAVADDYVYLWPDAADRYLPARDTGSGPSVLANVDSMTPPAVSPDGQRIAFSGAVGDESLGRYAIFLVNSNGSGLSQLTSGNQGEFDPAWSPDGARIVVAQNVGGSLLTTNCCRLAVVNAISGQVTGLTSSVGVTRPEYSAQGSFVVYDTPQGVYRISPSGGAPTLLASGGFDATSSPGEDRVAYIATSANRMEIRTVAAGGGAPKTVFVTAGDVEGPFWRDDRIYFLEYSGLGYDGRNDVALRSVSDTGGGLRTERAFTTHVVGVSTGISEPPSFSVGDINGDGDDDIAMTGPVYRSALLSDGFGFEDEAWDVLNPRVGWRAHLGGDFNGDDRADVASFLGSDGTWHVAEAGGGSYSTSVWADLSTADGWQVRDVGDFSGDGRDDIAQFHPSNGTWWVSRSTGSGFSTSLWADFSTPSGWQARVVGDFNGDGRDDIAQFHPSNGTWWVSRSTGSGFSTSLWADFSTPSGWSPQIVGDFNGDGRDDIANRHTSNGTWWVSVSSGSGFSTPRWYP